MLSSNPNINQKMIFSIRDYIQVFDMQLNKLYIYIYLILFSLHFLVRSQNTTVTELAIVVVQSESQQQNSSHVPLTKSHAHELDSYNNVVATPYVN